jgi:hypothetical protein
MRTFDTGATRGDDDDKFDYIGFLSPLVLEYYAAYLHEHRIQEDGELRASDNWKKGIPLDTYIRSAFRHFLTFWKAHEGFAASELLDSYDDPDELIMDALCGVLFNCMGYLHVLLTENLEEDERWGAEDDLPETD